MANGSGIRTRKRPRWPRARASEAQAAGMKGAPPDPVQRMPGVNQKTDIRFGPDALNIALEPLSRRQDDRLACPGSGDTSRV